MRKFVNPVVYGFVVLLLCSNPTLAHEPVTVTVGRPNVWSLEQAHYLLSRMHAENLDLQTKTPGEDKLDPNKLHSTRIEALQTLLDVGVTFDQAQALTQSVARKEFAAVTDRRVQIRRRLNRLHQDKIDAELDVLRLSGQLGQEEALARRQADMALIDREIELLDAELEGLPDETSLASTSANSTAGESGGGNDGDDATTNPTPAATPSLSSSLLDNLLDEADLDDPALHASTVLDNYIQMQYEIIAKQVSLLKDDVGPDKRLLFLELPVSIYSVPKRGDEYLVRARWTVLESCELPEQFLDTVQDALGKRHQLPPMDELTLQALCEHAPKVWLENTTCLQDFTKRIQERGAGFWTEFRRRLVPPARASLSCLQSYQQPWLDETPWREVQTPEGLGDIFTVDLIPRQASLNVNQIYKNQKRRGIAGAFSTLFGLGVKAAYQRQKETFDQFVYQDSFASGFGKGETEFGWTFGPLPGTRRVAPGVRTTYAVLVVPRDTAALKLGALGYGYRHRWHPEDWEDDWSFEYRDRHKEFFVPIPRVHEGFYITEVNYTPVPVGETAMVELEGTYFSPQVGVLVNGVPLKRVVSIARPEIAPRTAGSTETVGESTIQGKYEFVNGREIKMAFSMGPDYEGTPIISLVTPQKATPINRFSLTINYNRRTSLENHSSDEPMFHKPLALQALRFHKDDGQNLVFHLDGDGFRFKKSFVQVNGSLNPNHLKRIHSKRYEIQIPKSDLSSPQFATQSWEVRVNQSNRQREESAVKTFPNPWIPRLGKPTILGFAAEASSYEADVLVPLSGHLSGNDPKLRIEGSDEVEETDCTSTGTMCRRLSRDQLRVQASSKHNPIVLELTWTDAQGHAISTVTKVLLPVAPTIETIRNPAQKNAAKGLIAGNDRVQIVGRHLQNVTRVMFGDRPAQILSKEPNRLIVINPAHGEGIVQVHLHTDLRHHDQPVTNAKDLLSKVSDFTYVKPPKKE